MFKIMILRLCMNGLRLLGIERDLECWAFKDVQVVGFSGLSKWQSPLYIGNPGR